MEQKYSSKLDLIRCPAFSHTNVMRSIHPNKSICDIFMWNFDFKSLIRAHFSKGKKKSKGRRYFSHQLQEGFRYVQSTVRPHFQSGVILQVSGAAGDVSEPEGLVLDGNVSTAKASLKI